MNVLTTPFENNAGFCEYPRPQLVRDSFLSLDGSWDFSVDGVFADKITVPYPPESKLSGIFESIDCGALLCYERDFCLPVGFVKDRVLLHFGAVDTVATVFINGKEVGKNTGGYLPFCFDITDALTDGVNRIRVEVRDTLDEELPYGKQRKKRGGMWYTPISGIWQSVWLESVPRNYIKSVRFETTLDSVLVTVTGGVEKKTLLFEGKSIEFCSQSYLLKVDDPKNWTPESPTLYDIEILSGDDRVCCYFALRTVCVRDGKLLLNDKPYFFHGLLDQGYFSDGIYTPASYEGYKNDILTMKKCGFNMLRKHIKVEPDVFYYYCDKYGMAVFQDFVNSGKYNFFVDTALPNVFLKRGITHRASKRRKEAFLKTGEGIQDNLFNHPSVVYYTVFNEGWGQFEADKCYAQFKARDPSRVYDTTSGWFKEKLSDVESEHIYFKKVRIKRKARPTILSEFGGFSCRVSGHYFNPDSNTGYSFFTEDPAELEKRVIALYERDVIPNIKNGLYGAVLTQLSDVEDETNGLFTYDRQILKVSYKNMKKLSDKIFSEFFSQFM